MIQNEFFQDFNEFFQIDISLYEAHILVSFAS